MKTNKIRDIVVLSDLHAGSNVAPWPGGVKIKLPNGGTVGLSEHQKKLNRCWGEFWDWALERIGGKPFITVLNGDMIEGVHHHAKDFVTSMWNKHIEAAHAMLSPYTNKGEGLYYVYGTEAHVGSSAEHEETLAAKLGAIPCKETGQHGRWELWMNFGKELINFSHHIGTTTSTAYESSAVMRELTAAFVEAGQWGLRPPSMLIRSHRHRYIEVKCPGGRAIVTPAWQLRTPFVFKIDRLRAPQIGGLLIRQGEEGVHVREKIWSIGRSECVQA